MTNIFDSHTVVDAEFFDEEDLFQCGRCRKQFRSLDLFVLHKRGECPRVQFQGMNGNVSGDDRAKSVLDISNHFVHQIETLNSAADPTLLPTSIMTAECTEDSSSSSLLNVMNNSSILHLTPSMVLTEDSVAFSIPVNQHGCLAHIVTHGESTSASLQLPSHGLIFTTSPGGKSIFTTSPGGKSILLPTSSSLDYCQNESNSSQSPSQTLAQTAAPEIDTLEPVLDFPSSSSLERIDESNFSSAIATPEPIESSVILTDVLTERLSPSTPTSSNPSRRQSIEEQKRDTKPTKAKKRRLSSESENNNNNSNNSTTKKQCEYCGKVFKKVFNLHQHIRSHTGEKPFHCLVCGRGFTQKSNVKKHMQTHKVWPKLKVTLPKEQISVKVKDIPDGDSTVSSSPSIEYIVNNVYVCQYCNASFENHHKLKTHMILHKSEKLFKCIHKDCTGTFVEVEGLISHVKSHEAEMEYKCQQCPKVFQNLTDLGTHQYSHRLYPNKCSSSGAGNRSYRCAKCNSKYSTSEALNHHLLTSSHNYPCSHCSLVFVCERYLRRHLKVHGTGEPFRCAECGKLFKTENYLKSHLVIHSDSKPFGCETCGALFNRRDKLTRHSRIHESRKKFKCPFLGTNGCTREFYRKDKLKDHLLSHSRKSYPCLKCNKSFAWPTRLRHHLVEQHPEMLSSTTCVECRKIFKTKHHLKIHLCKGSDPPEPGKRSLRPKRTRRTNYKEESVENEEEEDVIYGDCDIMVKLDSGDKEEHGILSGLTNARHGTSDPNGNSTDPRPSQYSDNETEDDPVLATMQIAFEAGVESSMDPLMAGD